jgi:hypothetical protein
MPSVRAEIKKTVPSTERRQARRWKLEGLESSIGLVMDVSADGFRVLSRQPLQGTLEVAFPVRNQTPRIVKAQVVWRQRIGFDRYLVGLKIQGLLNGPTTGDSAGKFAPHE